jgi:beta-glucosidase
MFGGAPPRAAHDEALRVVARAAADADVAIVIARDLQSEGRDQASLALPNGQDRVIGAALEANPHTVVVLRTGGPVLMPWLEAVPAVLEAWYGGSRGGAALAKLLFGDVVPSGKLPITFPCAEADLPTRTPRQFPGVDGQAHYDEKLEVGYRHYDANDVTPLFPFGHGLSYTSFGYRSLAVTRSGAGAPGLTVSFEVVNDGDREGVETAQAYLSFPAQAGEPPQRLVGFTRVRLLAGESRRVEITVGERELSIWDEQAHDWRIVAGTHTVRVGGSSRDQPLSADVVIDGPGK